MPDSITHTFSARRFFDGHELRGGHRFTVVDGVLCSVEPYDGSWDHEIVSPGFIDLQMNGFDDISCADLDPLRIARLDALLLERGTTHWLATVVTDTKDRLLSRSAAVGGLMDGSLGCLGIHMEGPFLGSRHGAHDTSRVAEPDSEWAAQLVRATEMADGGGSALRLMTVGAEHPKSPSLIADLRSLGVAVSLGHTSPDEDAWDRAVSAGASMVTHLFNAMSGVQHRGFAMALRALVDRRVSIGLIADLVHVSPDIVTLAFAAAADRVCLVSDSVAWKEERSRSRGVTVRDGAPRLPDGTLAGSGACMADCVRNAVLHCGTDLGSTLRAATTIPGRVIGHDASLGATVGHEVSLVALDPDLHVAAAWRGLQSTRGLTTLC